MELVTGVDVYHEDRPDMAALKAKGCGFVAVKITQGATIKDSMAGAFIREARAAGLLVMPYHYFTPTGDATAQWQNFRETVQEVAGGFEGMLVPALDVEGDKNNQVAPMSGEGYARSALVWLSLLEAEVGVKGVVYTYPSFATEYLKVWLSGYPLWISSVGEAHPAGKPKSPITGWGTKWMFHQWTTTGAGNGIAVADQDVFNGGMEALRGMVVGVREGTVPVKVVDHATGAVVAQYEMVEGGDHLADQGKLYVRVG